MKKILILLFAFSILVPSFAPSIAFAQGGGGGGPTGGMGGKVTLENPLGDVDTFPKLIKAILDAAFIIGLPVAVLFIVIAGFRFVWARGNPRGLDEAKHNFLYTVIGIGVFFGAWTLAKIIESTISALGVGS
ncbi:MAG: TrbC/VirB2 family protein [Candidatus Pacebacteria bacterium]|nr:TrbC/VirB2 family protein [Candidatus Paceibacterota bacterium]